MDLPIRNYTFSDFKMVQNGNLKISKKFYAKGTSNIKLNSMNIIEEGVQLRGDLGLISMAQSTILDKDVIVRPPLTSSSPYTYKQVKIGSNCYIGTKSLICALSIGNNTFIGENSIVVSNLIILGW